MTELPFSPSPNSLPESSFPPSSAPLSGRESARRGRPFFLGVGALHLLALALWAPSATHTPVLWGVGLTAYLLGMRHAWDADHIAVIDNTSRKLLALGRSAYGVGFFFSLGHSSVVFLMAVAAAIVGQKLLAQQDILSTFGGWVGPFVAGAYLLTVAAVNLTTTARLWRSGTEQEGHLHGGPLARLLAPLTALVSRQWQVLPLGFLMGLGFDTASEVALLALAGQAGGQGLSWPAVLSLPLLFAAGMTLLDTLDGVAMTHAYRWALVDAGKKRAYNLLVTGLSGTLALIIGVVTLAQWAGEHFPAARRTLAPAQNWDVSPLGFWLAGLTLALFVWAQARWRRTAGQQNVAGGS